jgi:ribosome biogenesis SPOUT family RNA methylase Rps3
MAIDIEKMKREQLRWLILETLNSARPIGANEGLVLNVVNDVQGAVTALELRRELDYLADRGLATVTGKQSSIWHAELTREGVDVVEYTVECDPGIARPVKYW